MVEDTTHPTTLRSYGSRVAVVGDSYRLGERIPVEDFDLTLRMIPGEDLSNEQIGNVVELLREAFNGGPGWFALPVPEADHLRWKLIDPPFETRASLTEEPDGNIVAFSGRLHRRWIVRGEERIGADGVELALHPKYQGSGLYRRRTEISDALPPEEDFRISFGSHPTSLHRRRVKGTPELANPLDNLVRPLDIGKYVRRRATNGRPTGSRTRIALEQQRRSRVPKPLVAKQAVWRGRQLRQRLRYRGLEYYRDDYVIRTVSRFDQRLDHFFEVASRPFALIQLRNQETLNWRYADRRAGPFTIRIAEDGNELVGYAVTRATTAGADLADVLALPGREDVAYALIRDALDLGRRAGSPAIRAWMLEHHPYHRLLLHSGFMPIRRIVTPAFTDHGNTRDYGFIHDPQARMHIMLGDSDHV
ncbi:MAG: hypothetical protein H6674_04735 [Dehalococcoidia bacterium]|nr:hypothetical protein [Dehalococcoidia bacterium]MCB9491355.1 hypothetical protein [Dehalococcoidia bacterium]